MKANRDAYTSPLLSTEVYSRISWNSPSRVNSGITTPTVITFKTSMWCRSETFHEGRKVTKWARSLGEPLIDHFLFLGILRDWP